MTALNQCVRKGQNRTSLDHVAALAPTRLLHSLLECREASLTFWIVGASVHEYRDPPYSLRLLPLATSDQAATVASIASMKSRRRIRLPPKA